MVAGGKSVRGPEQSLTPPTNYCQMLQEISEVQRFEVQYFDIKDDISLGKSAIIFICQIVIQFLFKYSVWLLTLNSSFRDFDHG